VLVRVGSCTAGQTYHRSKGSRKGSGCTIDAPKIRHDNELWSLIPIVFHVQRSENTIVDHWSRSFTEIEGVAGHHYLMKHHLVM
jgi:hypothetical protein